MLATRIPVPTPWKSLVALAALAAMWPAARHGDRRAPAPPAAGPRLHVHVKLRVEAAALALPGSERRPLFSRLPPGTHDDRARWIELAVPAPDGPERALAALRAEPGVEVASTIPFTTLAAVVAGTGDADSCPISTPSFESYQGYLGPAPHGIDAPAAWRRGARGQGVWFADIEGAWNPEHEDLPGDRITHVGGAVFRDPSWRAHGTAVLGEVVGRDNGKGVVGIAPDVERVFTSSIGGVAVADAIDVAAEQLRPGDVLLIELQSTGPRGRYIPVELWDDVFDAIHAATARGVIVIEAAGNGGEDLDHQIYRRAFDRTHRDSGAILVGAGGPPRDGYADRERLDFSNYGCRSSRCSR